MMAIFRIRIQRWNDIVHTIASLEHNNSNTSVECTEKGMVKGVLSVQCIMPMNHLLR